MSNSNAISMDFNNDLNRIVVDYWNKVDDKNLKRPLRIIGELLRSSILENFRQEGRPEKWKRSVRAMMNDGLTLSLSGRLKGSISSRVENQRVSVYSDVIYAATQHFGDPKRNIPARPFMMIQDSDFIQAMKIIKYYIVKA